MELNFSNKTLYFINNLSINIEQSLFTKTMFTTKVRDHEIKRGKHRMKADLLCSKLHSVKIPLYTVSGPFDQSNNPVLGSGQSLPVKLPVFQIQSIRLVTVL